jgi:hypothetical protein
MQVTVHWYVSSITEAKMKRHHALAIACRSGIGVQRKV